MMLHYQPFAVTGQLILGSVVWGAPRGKVLSVAVTGLLAATQSWEVI